MTNLIDNQELADKVIQLCQEDKGTLCSKDEGRYRICLFDQYAADCPPCQYRTVEGYCDYKDAA